MCFGCIMSKTHQCLGHKTLQIYVRTALKLICSMFSTLRAAEFPCTLLNAVSNFIVETNAHFCLFCQTSSAQNTEATTVSPQLYFGKPGKTKEPT